MTPTQRLVPAFIRALSFFQMIEECLRIYVGLYEERISEVAPYGIKVRTDLRRLNRASLGQLIEMCARYSANIELLERTKALVQHRNHIAHESFKRAFSNDLNRGLDVEKELGYAKVIGDEAETVLSLLAADLAELRARQWPSLIND